MERNPIKSRSREKRKLKRQKEKGGKKKKKEIYLTRTGEGKELKQSHSAQNLGDVSLQWDSLSVIRRREHLLNPS